MDYWNSSGLSKEVLPEDMNMVLYSFSEQNGGTRNSFNALGYATYYSDYELMSILRLTEQTKMDNED